MNHWIKALIDLIHSYSSEFKNKRHLMSLENLKRCDFVVTENMNITNIEWIFNILFSSINTTPYRVGISLCSKYENILLLLRGTAVLSPPQHVYSTAVKRKSYSDQKKNASVVACFVPGRMRLDVTALNEQGFESVTATNIWRFFSSRSALTLRCAWGRIWFILIHPKPLFLSALTLYAV